MKEPSTSASPRTAAATRCVPRKRSWPSTRDAPIKLIDIDGDLVQANNVTTRLKAKHGLLDNAKSELELYDDIEIDGSNGLHGPPVAGDMVYSKEGKLVSKHPVDCQHADRHRCAASAMTMSNDTKSAIPSATCGAPRLRAPSARRGKQRPGPRIRSGIRASRSTSTTDELYVNDTHQDGAFTGNVVAVQGDTTLQYARICSSTTRARPRPDWPHRTATGWRSGHTAVACCGAKNGACRHQCRQRPARLERSGRFRCQGRLRRCSWATWWSSRTRTCCRGERLFVDRKTGKSRLESPAEGNAARGRIAATFYQNSDGRPKPAAQPKPTAPADASTAAMFGIVQDRSQRPHGGGSRHARCLRREKKAIFRGNVKAQQGDLVVRTVEMTVFYIGPSGFGLSSAGRQRSGEKQGQVQPMRVEAQAKGADHVQGRPDRHRRLGNLRCEGQYRVAGRRGRGHARQGHGRGSAAQDRPHDRHVSVRGRGGDARGAPRPPALHPPSRRPGRLLGRPDAAEGRACPPGKQCLLFYPKDVKDKAKELAEEGASPMRADETWATAWEPTGTSAQPGCRA